MPGGSKRSTSWSSRCTPPMWGWMMLVIRRRRSQRLGIDVESRRLAVDLDQEEVP
jgi:hypothetical protein